MTHIYQCLEGEEIDLFGVHNHHRRTLAWLFHNARGARSWVEFQNRTSHGTIREAKTVRAEDWISHPLCRLQLDLVGRIGVQTGELSGTNDRWFPEPNPNPILRYARGDATIPVADGDPRFIIHITNNRGGWGAGFVRAISARWKEPESEYRDSFREKRLALGYVSFPVQVEPNLYAVNMCAQDGYSTRDRQALSYDVLAECLRAVHGLTNVLGYQTGRPVTVHCPRIGCGLGGGSWGEVEPMLVSNLVHHGVSVTVYDP